MASFDFLENFFFISLAITFGLIMLLVYHFKSRIVAVEHRVDFMNECIVKTCQAIRELSIKPNPAHLGNIPPTPQPIQVIDLSTPPTPAKVITSNPVDHIMYQLREEDNESEDTFSNDEDEDTEDENEVVTVDETQMDSVSEHDHSDSESEVDETDDDVMDEVEVFHVLPSPKLDLAEPYSHNVMDDITTETMAPANEDTTAEVEIEIEPEPLVLENPELPEKVEDLGEVVETETEIEIETTTQPSIAHDDTISDISTFDKNAKEVYRKMSIAQLRTIAVSSGITVDTTKMKKPDLIKLLLQL